MVALFGLTRTAFEEPVLRGYGLTMRLPRNQDFEAWSHLRDASRAHLEPWEPLWPEDDLTRPAFRRRMRRYATELADDQSVPFFIFREDGALMGGLTIANIRRGVAQSCTIGYWIGQAHTGRGHMTNAVRLACRYGFDTLRLHRIEAACIPENEASRRVLEKVGFRREGYAREYLCIAGKWQDHLLHALLPEDLRA